MSQTAKGGAVVVGLVVLVLLLLATWTSSEIGTSGTWTLTAILVGAYGALLVWVADD